MSDSNSDDNVEVPNARSVSIAAQNDLFRQSFDPSMGIVTLTVGVNALSDIDKSKLLSEIRSYDGFKQDGNDPYFEHDFGSIELKDIKYFFKIDYYDKTMQYGSENPADPNQTKRVLTIMEASEY